MKSPKQENTGGKRFQGRLPGEKRARKSNDESSPKTEKSFTAKRSFSKDKSSDFNPDFSQSDRKPRSSNPRFGEERSFGDRPRGNNRGGSDRSFGDRKPNNKFGGDRSGGSRFGSDRPSRGDRFDKPGFDGDKPRTPRTGGSRFGDDRPSRGDRPSSGSGFDRPSRGGSKFSNDKPKFGGDRPRSTGGRPGGFDRSGSDRPRTERSIGGRFGSDRPSRGDRFDKPGFDSDKPRTPRTGGSRFGSDRPERGDRPSYGSDRPSRGGSKFSNDKPRFGSDKPRSTGYRGGSSENKFEGEGKRFGKSEGRPSRDNGPVKDTRSKYKKKKDNFQEAPRGFKGSRKTLGKISREREDSLVDGKGEIRLNRYIANSGICSRREADELIAQGLVKVNGNVVTELGSKVTNRDDIRVEDRKVTPEKPVYILLNKPKGYITSTSDPEGRSTVMDLIDLPGKERIYPVGRLDRNTTGVLLLTNDGELSQKLMHPSFEIKKIYRATLDKKPTKDHMLAWVEGVELEDGWMTFEQIGWVEEGVENVLGVEIKSGRNRIVRRMFEHFGYEVTSLDRVMLGEFDKLKLGRGKWRFLSEKEMKYIDRIKRMK